MAIPIFLPRLVVVHTVGEGGVGGGNGNGNGGGGDGSDGSDGSGRRGSFVLYCSAKEGRRGSFAPCDKITRTSFGFGHLNLGPGVYLGPVFPRLNLHLGLEKDRREKLLELFCEVGKEGNGGGFLGGALQCSGVEAVVFLLSGAWRGNNLLNRKSWREG